MSSSSCRIRPDTRVPVTTVPNPFIVNARSIGRRGAPSTGRRAAWRRHGDEGMAQGLEPLSRACRDGDDWCVGERSALQEVRHLEAHEVDGLVVDQVVLGERDDTAGDAEQAADLEVLARLRHDRFVGGDDQQHRIDAAGASQHVPDESLVAGHVHEGDVHARRSVQCAKPRSIVIPRAFSSFSRSGSVPVSACTRLLLP